MQRASDGCVSCVPNLCGGSVWAEGMGPVWRIWSVGAGRVRSMSNDKNHSPRHHHHRHCRRHHHHHHRHHHHHHDHGHGLFEGMGLGLTVLSQERAVKNSAASFTAVISACRWLDAWLGIEEFSRERGIFCENHHSWGAQPLPLSV